MSSARILSSNRVSDIRAAAIAAWLAVACVAGTPRPVHADQGGYREHEFREHEFHHDQFRDSRYHHDHYVPVLPLFYTRIWVGPYPYYYANDVYYVRSPQGYAVVDPPPGAIAMAPPPGTAIPPDNAVTELGPVNNGVQQMAPMPPVGAVPPTTMAPSTPPSPPSAVAQAGGNQLFVYPRQGQNADQQNRDRGECNNWAVSQTGRDPANAGGQMDADYQRAIGACLDARGYTVK